MVDGRGAGEACAAGEARCFVRSRREARAASSLNGVDGGFEGSVEGIGTVLRAERSRRLRGAVCEEGGLFEADMLGPSRRFALFSLVLLAWLLW